MTYPSTPHPEDSPGFDKYPQYSQETPEWALEKPSKGTGKVNLGEAIGWGFKAVFSSWYVWIIGTLLLGLVASALYVVVMPSPGTGDIDAVTAAANSGSEQFIPYLLQLLIMPFILTGMLAQIKKKRVNLGDFFHGVRYFQVVTLSIVQFLLGIVGLFLLVLPLVFAVIATMSSGVVIALLVGGVLLLSVLIGPFFALWNWYAADGYGIKESIVLGFKAGKRNYGMLLLFSVVGSLALMIGTILTLGLGALVLFPAYYLMYAHIFRQASQGELPTES